MDVIKKKNTRINFLITNTIIFAIGSIATKLISFLLVPLYTNVLSTEEYGVIDLLYTVCSFLIPLFSFNIIEAVLRFSLDKESKNNKIMSIAICCIIFMLIVALVVIPVLDFFDEFSEYKYLFYLYLITFGTSQIFLINLKGQQKLKLFSFGNFLYALIVSILNIYFLLFLNRGIYGYFLSYIIANCIVIIYGMFFGKINNVLKEFCFDFKLFKEMVKYSLILIPTTFMWWIMNFMDRIMVSSYISISANGIYAVSYKIPTILSVVSSIFTQAWLFSAIEEKDSEDNTKYTNNVFNFMAFGTIFIATILLVFIKLIYRFYVSAEFFEAWKYVPYLMVGYVFLNLSTFISTSYNVHKDSKGFLFSALIGAVFNFVLNFILIPLIGVAGAALATTISYIVVFIYRLYDTKKYLKITVSYEFIISIILMCICSVLLFVPNKYIIILQTILIGFIIYIYKKIWWPILLNIVSKIKKLRLDKMKGEKK